MSDDTEALKDALLHAKEPQRTVLKNNQLLSTGSTLMNLACTGRHLGGLPMGHYSIFVGDSGSGKTWFMHSLLAEAANSGRFDNYRLIYDNTEGGALMNVTKYFGHRLISRMEPPGGYDDQGRAINSECIEDLYFHLDDCRRDGRPYVYVVDSMDALDSKSSRKKFQQQKVDHRKGRPGKGEMSDGKAKMNSANLRTVLPFLEETGSILVFVAQTRDKMDAGPFEDPRTYSGGRSLKFYACFEMWTKVVGQLTSEVGGIKTQTGVQVHISVKKNRLTGRSVGVTVPIYWGTGMDDVGSCVDYLVKYKHWKKTEGGVITAPELSLRGYREVLIQAIERGDLELDLRELVAETWADVDVRSQPTRKRRYE